MGERADTFLAHFNRIEKWMRERLNNSVNMGFSEMTRRLSRKEKGQIAQFEEDLLQMAQLRNAIVHERIADDFVIAEPNEWAVQRIETIEQALTKPEKVVPKFAKRVTAFEITTSLETLLTIIAKKQYSQFPIYEKGVFKGLITVRGIGVWFAIESTKGEVHIANRTVRELLASNYKRSNYQFVSIEATVFEVEQMFREQPRLEAVLISKSGHPNGELVGIVRPRDLASIHREKE
nr:CBS domain-containing protein [Enterococcus faecalis]